MDEKPFRILLSASLILFCLHSGQDLTGQNILYSTIRGNVLDAGTLSPIAGATVAVENSDPPAGTVTDTLGHFRIAQVKIGICRIIVSRLGYAGYTSGDIIVSSGRESGITILMQEKALTSGEVEIRGDRGRYQVLNKMATVSVRSFSVDETFRFAGSYNDPARMAANFAGITSGIDNRNDIIVRGNSPMGMQWRIDDMEIPNPNHFAAVGTTGGPVTILNNNLLANSDFYTGTFPAQYGNTLAGIFDLRLRNGNQDRHEYWFQIGWNGLEFGAEGPFTKKHRATYLIAYRYSPLQFLNWFNINVGIVPKYQDLNLKITIPTRKAGTFSVTGIGGISYIELYDSRKDQSEWTFPDLGEDLSNGSKLGVLGITHQALPLPSLRLKTMLYLVVSEVRTKIDTFPDATVSPSPWAGERSEEVRLSVSEQVVKKFSPQNTLTSGLSADLYSMSFADSMMYHGAFMVNTNSREKMVFARGFIQWQHLFSDNLSVTSGIFGSWLSLNNSWSAEPRIGFDWKTGSRSTVNFGAGLYSQMQPRVIYFILTPIEQGRFEKTNLDLDFTRSAQVALGYNLQFTENLRFKTELYYQYLFGIPVKSSIPQYSLSNQGHEFFLDRQYADSLVNSGQGVNYGIECTFERLFFKRYYFLFTASLFNSKFNGFDGISRNTAFNVNYALNAAGGYEFVIGKRKWGVLSFGLRATWAGGNPYVPYNVEATVATAEPVYDWNHAYSPRFPEYRRLAFRFGIKRNLPGYNFEFLLDLQYRTSYTNIALQRIDPKTGEIRTFFSTGLFPMGTWRIQF